MPLMERLAFPFIGQGKAGVTAEGKREKEKEIRLSGVYRPSLHAGPADPIDRGGSNVILGPVGRYSMRAGVVRRSCLPSHPSGRNGQRVP